MKRTKTIFNCEYNSLIECLRQERQRLGLSQIEVAETLCITQSELSKIESFERKLDIMEFKRILKIYRINENNHIKSFICSFLELEI